MKRSLSQKCWRLLGSLMVLLMAAITLGTVAANAPTFAFKMVRSSAAVAAKCLADASAQVNITERGAVEIMDLAVFNLAPNTEYSLFITQVPNSPFGISWHAGEIKTDAAGAGHQRFIGRFSNETFAVAPGRAPAPVVHSSPFPDASRNPGFAPIHTYHLGLWFSESQVAQKAGCPNTVTPFDGDHSAGIQVLSTQQYPDDQGPLRRGNVPEVSGLED